MPEQEPLTPEQMSPAARNAVAAVCALVGGGIVALAAGIIPADESAFHAPHWVVGACGFVFMIAGFLVVVPKTMPRPAAFSGLVINPRIAPPS